MELEKTQMLLDFIEPAKVELKLNAYQKISFADKTMGKEYDSIDIKLMFPLTCKKSFLAIYHEGKEIAIVRDYRQLEPKSRQVVEDTLYKRYFIPEITRVIKVTQEYRLIHWSVDTNRGELEFYTKTRNDIVVKENTVYIRDIDSNRYLIKDHTRLSPQSQKELRSEI